MGILCFLGKHDWIMVDTLRRKCRQCDKKEVYCRLDRKWQPIVRPLPPELDF